MTQGFTQALPIPLPVSKGGTGNVGSGGFVTLNGVTDASAAAAGIVGEVISSTSASTATSLSTGGTSNVLTLSLTAGQWLISGLVNYAADATTTSTLFRCGISLTSATIPSIATPLIGESRNSLTVAYSGGSAGSAVNLPLSTTTINVSSTTSVYLVARADFAVSTMTCGGVIFATRIR